MGRRRRTSGSVDEAAWALGVEAQAHVARCAEILGVETRRRAGKRGAWSEAITSALEEHGDDEKGREARAEWDAANALWWQMAILGFRAATRVARRLRRGLSSSMDKGEEDLFQIARIACHRAAQTWRPGLGSNFETYCGIWAQAWVKRALVPNGSNFNEDFRAFTLVRAMKFLQGRGRAADPAAAATWLGLPDPAAAAVTLSRRRGHVSIDGGGAEGAALELAEDPDPEGAIVGHLQREILMRRLEEALSALSRRERLVVEEALRGRTAREVAAQMDVCEKQVRLLKASARLKIADLLYGYVPEGDRRSG